MIISSSKVYSNCRHTDNSRSPAPDIAVPRQALCYLSRSNRGLKNRRLFFTTPAFLSSSKSRKSQATKYTAFKTNSALNKHRISRNQWTANSLSFGAERSGSYGVRVNFKT